jgi:hypothetical protein
MAAKTYFMQTAKHQTEAGAEWAVNYLEEEHGSNDLSGKSWTRG